MKHLVTLTLHIWLLAYGYSLRHVSALTLRRHLVIPYNSVRLHSRVELLGSWRLLPILLLKNSLQLADCVVPLLRRSRLLLRLDQQIMCDSVLLVCNSELLFCYSLLLRTARTAVIVDLHWSAGVNTLLL